MKNRFLSKTQIKKYESKIKNSSWAEVKTYILPELRYRLGNEWNSKDKILSKEQYEKLLNLITKVHNKERYEI